MGIFEFEAPVRSQTDLRKLQKSLNYKTLANKTFTFSPEDRQLILDLRALYRKTGVGYAEGNYKLGEMFSTCVNSLIEESKIDKATINLVSSHGQSICGHPHWEFGDISVIAQRTGITAVGDFRPADVAAGGNGTPCTCTYDSIMLRPDAGEKWRVAINIGGTSSVTFCPPWPAVGAEDAHVPIGLDPGLGVFFIDLATRKINPELEYDAGGAMARAGTINQDLLAELLEYKYYK